MSTEKNVSVDVLVIGAGGSGLPAALMALETGAKSVMIIEKRAVTGGNAPFANGIFACDSVVQRKSMVDADGDEIFKKATAYHHYDQINPRVLRAYLKKSGETISWFMKKGFEFEVNAAAGMYYNQLPTWHIPKVDADHSRFGPIVRAMVKECKEKGIEIRVKTSCIKILQDANGKVTGALVKPNEGEEYEIHTPSVIMAVGGFMGRKDLLKKYFPFFQDGFFGFFIPNMGDGITLAEQAGAELDPFATLVREGCHSSDERTEHFLTCTVREPYSMWVNKLGRRFLDESMGKHLNTSANALLVQPDKVGYALQDDAMIQDVVDNGWLLPRYPSNEDTTTYREQINAVAERRLWVCKSDSLDEIAEWIGCDAVALKAQVDTYNDACEHGYDNEMVKDRRYLRPLKTAPFYAIKFGVMVVETAGPVRVNEQMEVLNKEYKPIPGLYAAGVIASGWLGRDYCGDHVFGSALGFSVNSGRIAGECAAKHALAVGETPDQLSDQSPQSATAGGWGGLVEQDK